MCATVFDSMASYQCHFATSLPGPSLLFPYDKEKTQVYGWSHGTKIWVFDKMYCSTGRVVKCITVPLRKKDRRRLWQTMFYNLVLLHHTRTFGLGRFRFFPLFKPVCNPKSSLRNASVRLVTDERVTMQIKSDQDKDSSKCKAKEEKTLNFGNKFEAKWRKLINLQCRQTETSRMWIQRLW